MMREITKKEGRARESQAAELPLVTTYCHDGGFHPS
jgi:hypothetical protein